MSDPVKDYAARARAYAEATAAGRIPAAKLTAFACRRHLEDLKRAARNSRKFPFYFDEAEADRICGFVERFPHVKGAWASGEN